ncbi:MAG TPA: iron-containing redox enzyme family protein [Polyangiaceae bacterium]
MQRPTVLRPFSVSHPRAFHVRLADFNRTRLAPVADPPTAHNLGLEVKMRSAELEWIEEERGEIEEAADDVPADVEGFLHWFENLREAGPGQGDPLFPWLAEHASLDEMRWFLKQEVGGEAGFEDLVALTQVKMPATAKLELASNYWDEMGQGHASGMHGPMLEKLADELDLTAVKGAPVWESLALGNLMVGLANNRCYAFQSIGALGAIELTAPGRAALVNAGLKRLGIGGEARRYFALHATLDIKHSERWNRSVLRPLVEERPELARPIAEGALLRLRAGARCFERYRHELGLDAHSRRAS